MITIGNLFSRSDYVLAGPMLVLAAFAIAILIVDLFLPKAMKRWNAVLALAGLVAAGFALAKVWATVHYIETPGSKKFSGFLGSLAMDRFAIYFSLLFLVGAAVAILMSVRYMEIENEEHGEYYALILFAVIGMICMAAGFDLILLFVGLELMALSTYVLVGFLRRDRRSNEAALKYLLLGAFSSGIFAYGLSLFYGLTGSTNLAEIADKLAQRMADNPRYPIALMALITTATGLLFKIAAVPFHQWAPDAYEGAPTAVTGFMSVAVKAAGWAMLLRIFLFMLWPMRAQYTPMLIFVAVATMIGGNFAALTQTNVKRLLAYSSIAHVGYMLLGLVASDGKNNSTGIKGILVYLLVYTFMNLGAFAVITSLRRRDIIGDELDDLGGLFYKAPSEAILLLIFLLSLAGIPPLAGFWGKYYIFLSLMETGHYALAVTAVAFSVLGLYYYLRIANAAFMRESVDAEPVKIAPSLAAALWVSAAATVGIGMFPEVFLRMVNWSLALTGDAKIIGLLR
ncbi:MAG TPA: NADH-quinone oxidoreductase subunit N [Candidatus Koribacter sp.]